jgi:hypothetical protein
MATLSKAEQATQRMRYHFSRLQTSPQFAAVLDFLFDLQPRTEPVISELALLDGRLVVARTHGDMSFRHYVGSRNELAINLVGFVDHLGLGRDEREYVLSRIDAIPRREAA